MQFGWSTLRRKLRYEYFDKNSAVICQSNLYFKIFRAVLRILHAIWAYLSNKIGLITKIWPSYRQIIAEISPVRNFAHCFLYKANYSVIFHLTSKKSTLNLRQPRPIRRSSTIMVLSDFSAPVFWRGDIQAPRGLGSLSRNKIFQKIKNDDR